MFTVCQILPGDSGPYYKSKLELK